MAKATFTVEVEYDPEMTHPDGLATALDILLETALSTPGILEEHGDPQVGEFKIAPDTYLRLPPVIDKKAKRSYMVIEVVGGVIQDIFSAQAGRAFVVDWDCRLFGGGDLGVFKIKPPDSKSPVSVSVCCWPILPFRHIEGSDVALALAACGEADDVLSLAKAKDVPAGEKSCR